MGDISTSEFDLHVWKRPGIGGRAGVYTIGVCDVAGRLGAMVQEEPIRGIRFST